jgi:hypothetical protein
LPSTSAQNEGAFAGRRGWRELHERHHGDRIEEVHPDHIGSSPRGRSQRGDRDRRRVRREHHLGSGDGPELFEDPSFRIGILGRGLDREVDRGECTEFGRGLDPTERRGARIVGKFAARHRGLERPFNAGSSGRDQLGGTFHERDPKPRARTDLHDARAHETAAHDADVSNILGLHSHHLPGPEEAYDN